MGTHPPSGAPLAVADHLQEMVEMNEALVLGVVRQHELTEEAQGLNAQLRAEITQRQQAEEALRESEEQFRTLFACAPMAVFACDREGRIQHFNSRAVEIWGREPVCNLDRFCGSVRLWLPDGSPLGQSPMLEVLRTGVPAVDVELSIERPGGSQIPVLANFAPLKTKDGTVTGAIASFLDLTERKKLEQQSLRSQRMESIGTLAGGIAHDLNNSLGPIIMALDLLKLKFTDSASRDLIGVIDASAKRGADMVRQVLSFARGVEGLRVEVQVPQLVREIEKIVNETFLQHIQVRTMVPPEIWPVLGDATQLHQVLLNLCLNARDAMPDGGVLAIAAGNRQVNAAFAGLSQNPIARPGPHVMLEVKDTGTGMPSKVLENIFDPFFTTKDFGKGSGLGLSTSLAIVKSHGGFLTVTSELGKGTSFQVFLPAHLRAAAPVPLSPTTGLPQGHGELILVVDDEEPMRRITQQVLEMHGYRVVLACDGAQALSIYAQRRTEIAAVITDMSMPMMEGTEVIRILRTMNPTLPIIGASGLASSTYAPRLASLGVKHILSKPYTTPALLQLVQQVLQAGSPAAAPGTAGGPS